MKTIALFVIPLFVALAGCSGAPTPDPEPGSEQTPEHAPATLHHTTYSPILGGGGETCACVTDCHPGGDICGGASCQCNGTAACCATCCRGQ
jgi:hypothetical protein